MISVVANGPNTPTIQNEFIINQINYSSMAHEFLLVIIGAVIGLLVTLLWEEIKSCRKNKRFFEIYSRYEGIYLSFKKYATDETDENNAIKYFELVRQKNVFMLKNGISMSGNEDFYGQIRMSEAIYSYGSGYYQHQKDKNNVIRFGFLEIQLTGNEILAHEIIYNDVAEQNSDSYRWVKQDFAKKDDIFMKCRQIQQRKFLERSAS